MLNDNDRPYEIVVGVDGSEMSLEAPAWAGDEAMRIGASLTAVMAWTFPNVWGPTPTWPPGMDPIEETRKQLAQAVRSVLGKNRSLAVRESVIEGHAASVLIDAAQRADLLVVGRHGHTQVVGKLFGSISQHCASHAPCPVTIVGPGTRKA